MLDVRAGLREFELGFQYFVLDAGYGTEYAGDRVQNDAVWARPEYSLSLRTQRPLSASVRSSSLLRYRRSDVSNDSYFLESAPGVAAGTPAGARALR